MLVDLDNGRAGDEQREGEQMQQEVSALAAEFG